MRSAVFLGCLLWVLVYVHGLTRFDNPVSIRKRAASPQLYTPRPNVNNQSQPFQWVKVNNQWVRSDGVKLPGYSQANVPYNQAGNQWNTKGSNSGPNQPPRPGTQQAGSGGWANQQPVHPRQQVPQGPLRQNSTSQGGVGWNPSADRALIQDLPQTTPRPVQTTAPPPVTPQTPPPAYKPSGVTPPINAPFGSGVSGQQGQTGLRGGWNPDASLTYGTGGRNVPTDRNRAPANPNAGRVGSNPWGGLSV